MVAIEFAFAIVNILLKTVLDLGIKPFVFITYRLSISAIFLAPIGYFWERNNRPKLTPIVLFYIFCSAIVGTSLTQYFFLLGIQNTSATFASAFINMVPVITFIMAIPFGLETLNIKSNSGRAKIMGTLVCFGGTLLLTLYKGMALLNSPHSYSSHIEQDAMSSRKKTEKWTIGCAAMTLGTLLWSSWFLIQTKISKKYPCQCTSTALMAFFGATQSAILNLFMDRKLSVWILNGKLEIFALLFSGMVGSGLCYLGLSWCVKKRGPLFTAAFSPLVQIMAAIIDIPFLHEELHLGSMLGSVIVMIGLYILLWGKNQEVKNLGMSKIAQENEDTKQQEPQLQAITVPRNI